MGIVEELENAIDIVELVGKYSKIKKAWANYKGLCPFPGHNEKTPSFVVSPAKQIWYCFWCHRWGGPLKFIMDIENCEFKEAIQILWNLTGKAINNNFDAEKHKIQKNLFSLYKDATNYYKEALKRYPEVKKYLMERGFNEESLQNFHLGYSDSWIELYNYLKSKEYDDDLIAESKIFLDVKSRKDKFIGRVIFPIQNTRGDFVAFTGRIMWSWEPKYLNSPASHIYDKSSILYGLYSARHAITNKDFVIVTEWNPDTIALQQYGFTNSVAVSGTALTEKHLTILKRLTKKIYLCFDNDNAWEKATKLSLETMKNNDFEVKIISLSGGKDPDEILQSGWDFQKLIDQAMSPIGYYIEKSSFNINSIDEKKKLLTELFMIIKSYSDNIEKDFYLKEVAQLLDINQKVVYDLFNRTRFKNEKQEKDIQTQPISSEEIAIWYILIDEKYAKIIEEKLIFQEGINKDLQGILAQWSKYLDTLDLETKEKYKGISLKIEDESIHHTDENKKEKLEKLILWLDREIYKKLSLEYKNKMNSWDTQALQDYTQLIAKAKKLGIK